jgi:hypothetical protein
VIIKVTTPHIIRVAMLNIFPFITLRELEKIGVDGRIIGIWKK